MPDEQPPPPDAPPPDDRDTWVDRVLQGTLVLAVLALAASRAGFDPAATWHRLTASFGNALDQAVHLASALGSHPTELPGRPGATPAERAAFDTFRTAYERAADLQRQKKPSEALPFAEATERLDPALLQPETRGAGLILHALILADLSRFDDAQDLLARARPLVPAPQAHDAFAALAVRRQDWRQAAASLRDYLDAGGKPTPQTYLALGVSYDHLGDADQASDWITRGRAEFPRDPDLAKIAPRFARDARSERSMTTRYSDRFALKFVDVPEQAALTDQLLALLDRDFAAVCTTFSFTPDEIIPVILYPSSSAYYSASGAPQWSAAQYDGKIRLPLPAGAPPSTLDPVISHECTHYVVHRLSAQHCPAWLDEGLAQLAERREEAWARDQIARAGGPLPLTALEAPFEHFTDPTQARLAYATALTTTRRLNQQLGAARIRELLTQLGTGRPTAEVLQEYVGLDSSAFTR